MTDNLGTPPVSPVEEKPKSNTGLIIAIVVIVVLCCCCAVAGGGWYLWNNGDQLFGSSALLQLVKLL
jgi:hypothetical protein